MYLELHYVLENVTEMNTVDLPGKPAFLLKCFLLGSQADCNSEQLVTQEIQLCFSE